ncbi:uncharacterized protein KD926_004782 [Aspergillus affinis]|uniref:uncharacterized protein n=1 Tax=Aspergillus affinis TaxID=1070780 RepID=UPI0022FF0DB1|nr:uncharacterized protein KD926_004782 [Aspergillus affinis]KAI9042991.1 hypothetical protein KD926_004782 [Aspergillus affinis]
MHAIWVVGLGSLLLAPAQAFPHSSSWAVSCSGNCSTPSSSAVSPTGSGPVTLSDLTTTALDSTITGPADVFSVPSSSVSTDDGQTTSVPVIPSDGVTSKSLIPSASTESTAVTSEPVTPSEFSTAVPDFTASSPTDSGPPTSTSLISSASTGSTAAVSSPDSIASTSTGSGAVTSKSLISTASTESTAVTSPTSTTSGSDSTTSSSTSTRSSTESTQTSDKSTSKATTQATTDSPSKTTEHLSTITSQSVSLETVHTLPGITGNTILTTTRDGHKTKVPVIYNCDWCGGIVVLWGMGTVNGIYPPPDPEWPTVTIEDGAPTAEPTPDDDPEPEQTASDTRPTETSSEDSSSSTSSQSSTSTPTSTTMSSTTVSGNPYLSTTAQSTDSSTGSTGSTLSTTSSPTSSPSTIQTPITQTHDNAVVLCSSYKVATITKPIPFGPKISGLSMTICQGDSSTISTLPPTSTTASSTPTVSPSPTEEIACFETHGSSDADKLILQANLEEGIDEYCRGGDYKSSIRSAPSDSWTQRDPVENNHYFAGYVFDDDAADECHQLWEDDSSSFVNSLCSTPLQAIREKCEWNGGRVRNGCGEWWLGTCKQNEPMEYLNLAKAHVLGDRLLDTKFQNASIDVIVERSQPAGRGGYPRTGPEVIGYIYQNTAESALIRDLFVDLYSSHGTSSWLDYWRDSEPIPVPFLFRLASRLMDGSKVSITAHKYYSTDDVEPAKKFAAEFQDLLQIS